MLVVLSDQVLLGCVITTSDQIGFAVLPGFVVFAMFAILIFFEFVVIPATVYFIVQLTVNLVRIVFVANLIAVTLDYPGFELIRRLALEPDLLHVLELVLDFDFVYWQHFVIGMKLYWLIDYFEMD